ncbi:hypothetical protein B0A48_16402 [Cryoendolithus antarcticus]|uniref:Uncharacterized protein n=1 Tax=Cryoendolithus antarcticus TaxID=1507870 RepID=A0A1V8SDU6_9PEZI|nr:hypothetical protein B0A48_16402 [Cryoendolithus antarcticus]
MSNVSLASASTIYSRTLKLVTNFNGTEDGGDAEGTPKKGTKATPKKRKSTGEDGEDDNDDATPTKKPKATPKKRGEKVVQAEKDGEGEEQKVKDETEGEED